MEWNLVGLHISQGNSIWGNTSLQVLEYGKMGDIIYLRKYILRMREREREERMQSLR